LPVPLGPRIRTVRVGVGDLRIDVEDALHRRRSADDALEAYAPAPAPASARGPAERHALEHALDDQLELVVVERLRDVVAAPSFIASTAIFSEPYAVDHHHGGLGVRASDPAEHVHAGSRTETEVGDDEVEAASRSSVASASSTERRGLDVVPRARAGAGWRCRSRARRRRRGCGAHARWLRDGEADLERGRPRPARDGDRAAMRVDRPLGDREPEAGARGLEGYERVEDSRCARPPDAGPVVDDAKNGASTVRGDAPSAKCFSAAVSSASMAFSIRFTSTCRSFSRSARAKTSPPCPGRS
jgi:hypothetical protein